LEFNGNTFKNAILKETEKFLLPHDFGNVLYFELKYSQIKNIKSNFKANNYHMIKNLHY